MRTFDEMIRAGSTFDPYFHRMIVGRVVAVRDPAPAGGKAKAVMAVAAHPTGFVPVVARVRFYRPPPGTWIEDNLEFKLGQRWVVIARHLHADGSYETDGGCGRSRPVSRDKFRSLIALDRRLS
jgi:hypothetical protein